MRAEESRKKRHFRHPIGKDEEALGACYDGLPLNGGLRNAALDTCLSYEVFFFVNPKRLCRAGVTLAAPAASSSFIRNMARRPIDRQRGNGHSGQNAA